jgi:hypothetical protein
MNSRCLLKVAYLSCATLVVAASRSDAAYKTVNGGITVSYSGDGASAYYDSSDGTLTIEITQGGGSLKVTVGPTANATWGDYVDIYISADNADLKSISIKGSATCTPYLCGQVNYASKFNLTGGVVGDTDYYGQDFGLGSISDTVTVSIGMKYSYTTAQLFGYAYPVSSVAQIASTGDAFQPMPKTNRHESAVIDKRELTKRIQSQLR